MQHLEVSGALRHICFIPKGSSSWCIVDTSQQQWVNKMSHQLQNSTKCMNHTAAESHKIQLSVCAIQLLSHTKFN